MSQRGPRPWEDLNLGKHPNLYTCHCRPRPVSHPASVAVEFALAPTMSFPAGALVSCTGPSIRATAPTPAIHGRLCHEAIEAAAGGAPLQPLALETRLGVGDRVPVLVFSLSARNGPAPRPLIDGLRTSLLPFSLLFPLPTRRAAVLCWPR